MKLRILALSLACIFYLCGQKKFSWQEACFNNPGAPYCKGRDFAVKKTKDGKTPSGDTYAETLPVTIETTIDAGGIDWRFADPSADALAVLTCTKLSSSPLAHSLIDQLGASLGLNQADARNVFRGLSAVDQVALSVREDRIVVMVIGRAPDSILPALEAGWKSAPLPGNALLIGHTDAVDQAALRLSTPNPLGELPRIAFERQTDREFWAVGSAKLAGQEAVAARVKRFSVTASMQSRLISETNFEFDAVPDARDLRTWLKNLGNDAIDGNVVRVKVSMEAEETRQSSGQIAASPLGQRLGVLLKAARYLPLRDTATTVHNRPVIYGLDDGPREVKYNPSTPEAPVPASPTSPSARNKYSWVIQSTRVAENKYSSYYYESATDRSVEKPLTLPAGAAILGVFPDDCTFSVRNESGASSTFQNEAEAKAKGLGPGTWSVYPLKCGGVAVFLK